MAFPLDQSYPVKYLKEHEGDINEQSGKGATRETWKELAI